MVIICSLKYKVHMKNNKYRPYHKCMSWKGTGVGATGWQEVPGQCWCHIVSVCCGCRCENRCLCVQDQWDQHWAAASRTRCPCILFEKAVENVKVQRRLEYNVEVPSWEEKGILISAAIAQNIFGHCYRHFRAEVINKQITKGNRGFLIT